MTREIGFLLVLLLNTIGGMPIDDDHGNFVVDLRQTPGNHTIRYGFVSPKGNGTCTFTVTRKDGLQPINCTDPLAGSSYTIVGKKYDVDLGTLDSRGAPYTIRIEYFNVMCGIAISLQSFPLDYQSYCEFTCINCDDAEAPFRKCPNGHSLTPIGDCVNNWILHSGDFGTTRH